MSAPRLAKRWWVAVASLVVSVVMLPSCSGDVSAEGPDVGDAGAEDGEPPGCVSSEPAAMVQLPQGYAIDATEVARCQYQAWLDTSPSVANQDPACAWNTEFTSSTCRYPPGEDGNLPMGCVDWCDAYAYCKGVGKRLCGKIGGGPNAMVDYADPSKSQWFNACSSGGQYYYTYGNEYDNGTKCNDADRDKDHYAVAGSLPDCQSPDPAFSGVFDLNGNVWEWEDSCQKLLDGPGECMTRGGSNLSPEVYSACGFESWSFRDHQAGNIGFRCCSP